MSVSRILPLSSTVLNKERKQKSKSTAQRLQSLDVVRGITVACMIMVNNGYRDSFEMLRHADWNGLSVSDFVFPFFLFIMGVAMFLSFSKSNFVFSGKIFMKILKRTAILLFIGVAINWFDLAVYGGALNFAELRFWAVLQRIAICYFFVSLIAFTFNRRFILPLSIFLLILYTAILTLGNGYSTVKEDNILYVTDLNLFGDSHLYHKSAVDPEGLLSTISAITNVLFGFYCGMKIKSLNNLISKSLSSFVFGTILLVSGFLINFFLPANKHIWSPSFALITSGACALFIGIFIKWIDMDKYKGPFVSFFKVFGVNALLLYITSEMMAIIFGAIGFSDFIFSVISSWVLIPPLASLCYALFYVLLNFIIGYPLWKKRIYVKL